MKISQKEFSKATGIPESTISEWKSKNKTPSADKIPVISKSLNVSNDWLLTGSDYVDAEVEVLISIYRCLDETLKKQLIGYAHALSDGLVLRRNNSTL